MWDEPPGVSLLPTLLSCILAISLFARPQSPLRESDPLIGEQWQEEASGIVALRAAGADGRGAIVGIVDGGFDRTHPEFSTTDLTLLAPSSGEPFDPAHGTAVLGVIAAAENGVGGVGVAPGAKFIARASAKEDDALLLSYLEDLADRGARVINLSLSYDEPVVGLSLELAYEELRDRGVLVVAAAGNSGFGDNRIYPSRLPAVLSIGAHDRAGGWSGFSVRSGVILSAPGEGIVAPLAGGGYDLEDGTSFAAPIVTGTIAALISDARALDAEAIVALLLESAAEVPGGPRRLDAAAALALLDENRPIARFTQLPALPRTSLMQLVTIRVGMIGVGSACRIELSFEGRASGSLPCRTYRSTLETLLERVGTERRAGSIELSLVVDGETKDRGSVDFDLDLAPFDPEPEDRHAPIAQIPLDAPWLSRTDRLGATEVRFVDNRPLRAGGIFCDAIDGRSRDATGTPSPWSRQLEGTRNLPHEIEGSTMRLRLPNLPADLPGRLEWRVDCADASGNRAEPILATIAVPLEGGSLRWDIGDERLRAPGARNGDLAGSSSPGATIRWSAYGSRLAIIAPTGAGLGRFELIIDGLDRCIIDLAERADGSAREARDRATVIGPGSRCGGRPISTLSTLPSIHELTLRVLPGRPGALVPIDAIAIW